MPLYHNTLEVEYIEDDKESLSGLSGGNQANGTNMVGAKVFFFRKTQLRLAPLCAHIPGARG